VLTEALPPGADVTTGAVLYRAEGDPAVAVVTDQVFWRDLDTSVDGPDVRALEQALADLGYGAGLTVDEEFDGETADAVEAWEADLGREDPDGSVDVGDLVAVPAATTVSSRVAEPGDRLTSGSEVLRLTGTGVEVTLDVAADDLGPWREGAPVTITRASGDTSAGTVTAVGTEVADDDTIEVVVTADQDGATPALGSEVDVTVVEDRVAGAVTVPVSALVDGPGDAAAVRVPDGDGGSTTVVVTYGLVVDGLVEIIDGIIEGTTVILPG
jgi:peptidoglycan hydrolase-like protein with peptidoglycan-binding domain